jgi:ABC-type transport system involved in multi-copper enzyme maturation permease subunit
MKQVRTIHLSLIRNGLFNRHIYKNYTDRKKQCAIFRASRLPKSFSEIGLFLLFIVFFTGSMSAIGMFTSVMCRSSNMSLLFSVSLWILFLIAIPNLLKTMSMAVYPVEKENVLRAKIENKYKEIEARFPDGKWSASSDPFFPNHKIRAEMQMAFDKNEADFLDAHLQEQFRQVERLSKTYKLFEK